MRKEIYRDNYRVEVYPRNPLHCSIGTILGIQKTEHEAETQCRDIAEQIERHVDNLPSRGPKTCVLWDTWYVCSFCGADWTEGAESPHNGGCCDKDIENMPDEAEGE